MSLNKAKDHCSIVGAGLVGSLLSLFLAKRGINVDVYERRPDMRKEKISAGRSINLAISERGLYALDQVGLKKAILDLAIPMRGRMMHSVDGQMTFQPYGKDETECINSISRGDLNKILMTAAEDTGKVKFHYNEKLTGLNLETHTLFFENAVNGEKSSITGKPIFGTDGSASVVRNMLLKKHGLDCSEVELAHGYKELTVPAAEGSKLEKNALHIWPRGTYMLIALPNLDGSFTCTLFLPFKGPLSFENLKSFQDVKNLFSKQFPDALALMPNLNELFFSNPTGHMVTVKCPAWSFEDKALLMGDAAHAIVPFFGQGMNCGFEDCTVLDELMGQCGAQPNWSTIFSRFESARKINSDSIADMAVENFIEMRDKVGDQVFLFRKKVEKLLNTRFPSDYVPRYSMVSFSRIPYEKAYEAGVIQGAILDVLCAGIRSENEIDMNKASQLINEKLAGFMRSILTAV